MRLSAIAQQRETEAWLRAKCEAEQLLKGNDWEKAQRLGERLMELDQGTTPAGPNVLAEVSQKRGDHQTAKTFLEMARDAVMSLPFTQTPRCLLSHTTDYPRRSGCSRHPPR